MSEVATLLTRLQAMHDDIAGVTAYTYPPPVVRFDALPVIYAVHDGYTEEITQSDTAIRSHRFLCEVLVKSIQNNQAVTAEFISAGVKATSEWIDTVTTYYNDHRDMSTSALPRLNGVAFAMTFDNDGVGQFEMNAGSSVNASFFGTHFTLTVPMMITGV